MNGLTRGLLDRIRDAYDRHDTVIYRDVHGGLAFLSHALRSRLERPNLEVKVGHESGISERHWLGVYPPPHALAAGGREVRRIAEGKVSLLSCGYDRRGKWVLAAAFETGCEAKGIGFLPAVCHGDPDEFRLTLRQRAGLVENERV